MMHRRTQWLIERATHAMLHWLGEAERLSAQFDRRMAEEASRASGKGQRPIDGKISWAGTTECKDLISNGVWAHRKVRSYSAVVQALSARQMALGESAAPLDTAITRAESYPGVFDMDSTPGVHRTKPWSWGLRHKQHSH